MLFRLIIPNFSIKIFYRFQSFLIFHKLIKKEIIYGLADAYFIIKHVFNSSLAIFSNFFLYDKLSLFWSLLYHENFC